MALVKSKNKKKKTKKFETHAKERSVKILCAVIAEESEYSRMACAFGAAQIPHHTHIPVYRYISLYTHIVEELPTVFTLKVLKNYGIAAGGILFFRSRCK